MVTDKDSNKPRGYAFIEYVHTRDMKGFSSFHGFLRFLLRSNFSYNLSIYMMQLHISKLMGRRLIIEGCLSMSNVVELFRIGDLAGLVVDLEQLEWVVKMLTRDR